MKIGPQSMDPSLSLSRYTSLRMCMREAKISVVLLSISECETATAANINDSLHSKYVSTIFAMKFGTTNSLSYFDVLAYNFCPN